MKRGPGAAEPSATIVTAGDPRAVPWAIDALGRGALIALPTDTVYGLAARLDRPAALDALFRAKGRADSVAVPVLVSRREALGTLVAGERDGLELLAARFWPGPLTIVVPASPRVPERVTAGTGAVGLRMPDQPIALAIIEGCGGALAVTSANRSGEPSLSVALDVARTFPDSAELVIDDGPSPGGQASTVIGLTTGRPEVLREGPIDRETILSAWGSWW